MYLERESINTSSDKISRFGSANSRDRRDSVRKLSQQEKDDEGIQDKTQISVKKYYQGTTNYQVVVKVKMVPYEQKLNTAFLSIENLDSKTIVLRNKPDIIRGNNKIQITRDISTLQKDKVQTFDWVFGENENSEIMAVKFLQNPVQNLLKGYNQSIILYGGVDSGKTHLAMGNLRDPGLIILLLKEVLYHKNELEEKGIHSKIFISLCSFQNQQFYDCIIGHPFPLEVHEDSQKQLYISGLYEAEVKNLLQGMRMIKIAQLHLQKYEQNIDKSKDLLKNTNLIFEIKCIQEDSKDMDKRQIISSLKLIKFERETFNDAINAGAQNSVLASLNNCFRILSEINLKTRKSNQIPYKANKLIEYFRDCIGGNSQTYLIGCANPLSQNKKQQIQQLQDTEAMIRYLNIGRSITTTPEIVRYSNKTQENYAEVYQKLIKENIQGWILEFINDQANLTKQQLVRLSIIGNILSKIQQYLNKLLRIYTEVQEIQELLKNTYKHIIDTMSKAYSKSITSSDIKEYYIGKLQQYNIDFFKQILMNYSPTIEGNLTKLYKLKMKAEVWEQRLVQHLKLKELRESKPDDLLPKDVERLVQVSKQSKKLYQFYNEQICLSQFDYVKSKELLNSLFVDINQIKQISSLSLIPTLQQINSTQFIEVKNKNGSVSIKSIEDINFSTEGKSPLTTKKTNLQHQMSSFKLSQRAPSIFQQQKDDSVGESSYENEESSSPKDLNSARKKNQKSQFLIMNILNIENEEMNRKNTICLSNENLTQNSDKLITQDDENGNQPLNIKQLQKRYLKQKNNQKEPTKFIYVNNKKIEVKKKNFQKPRKSKDQQNSINQSSIVLGAGETLHNSQEKYYIHESVNYGNTNSQLLSQDQSLISQIVQNKSNDQMENNQLEGLEKYQSINQLLNNETSLFSHRASSQLLPQSNKNAQFLVEQGNQVKSSFLNKDTSKQDEVSQRIQSYQLNLPYLSQLLENQTNLLNEQPTQDMTGGANPIISLMPSNQISMIQSPQQNSNQYISKQNIEITRINNIENSLLNLSPKLELDDGILNDIFQKSKISSINELKNENKYRQYQNKIQQEYQFGLPKNIQSLHKDKTKQYSLSKTREYTLGHTIASQSLLKQLQSPISNYNIVNKKLSLINLRGQPLYETNLQGKDIGYFRTQLKESSTPLPKDYFFELLLRSQQIGRMEQIKQTHKHVNQNSLTNLNQSINKTQQEVGTQSSNDQLNSNIFKRYEHQPDQQHIMKNNLNTSNQNKSVEKVTSSQEIKIPKQAGAARKSVMISKDQIGIKLPSINETLQHRSKYSKFFLK